MGQRRRGFFGISAIAASVIAVALPAGAAAGDGSLEMYQANVDAQQLSALEDGGYDVASVESIGQRRNVDLVLTGSERRTLAEKGIQTQLLRDSRGRTVSERAAEQAKGGYRVFNDYDGSDGIAAELRDIARRHPALAQLKRIGESVHGRPIYAMRLTVGPRNGGARGQKPTVLYQGTTHAREWISTEVTMRALRYFIAKRNKRGTRRLLRTRELWFVPVVNPDGYQYTFDGERLWRKNLRDNDDDGKITVFDGVDINRNYPERWGYDDEGSASATTDETYRGTRPASEPETRADMNLVERIEPTFAVSYHSYGPLLLYPQGWQVQTPTADDPIYEVLSGDDAKPAIKGFDPDLAAELYTTNGEFTDWAHGSQGVLAWTPELEEGCDGCGFVFPDSPKKVRREFNINRPFIVDVARSATRPARPRSHLGRRTKPLYLQTVALDPTRAHNPGSDFRFRYSYGGPQQVQVLARKSVGNVRAHYRVNGGRERSVATAGARPGERFSLNQYGRYYHELRGVIPAGDVGDRVEVWFAAGKRRTGSFTYRVVNDDPADVLIVAAEDYTGNSNSPAYPGPTGPNYLSYYEDAITASGRSYDVYDVDARGRIAPDALGVLGHYKAVVYYTGNDLITRDPNQNPGEASRLANDEMLELRSYLNERGKLLYTGQYAGYQYAFGYPYDAVANGNCAGSDETVIARCQLLSDDFLQYYLGAGIYNDDAGTGPNGPLDVIGVDDPYKNSAWSLNGGTGASNQEHTASFLTTSSLLPVNRYPQFASDAPATYVRDGAAPFEPFDGQSYMYSDRGSNSYKRLLHRFDLTGVGAANANMNFAVSYDTEPSYDHVIVEVHHVGQNDWTTLPDQNGHTTGEPGDACEIGWTEDLHPFLKHYETFHGGGNVPCERTGTTGEWNSATGRSQGWERWQIDLSDYAGERIEVSISYVNDYSVQGVGTFVDDIQTGFGDGTTSFEDDASPLDGWTVPGEPAGSPPNPNDWRRTTSVGFEEGAVVSTPDTLYFGFGFEGIADRADRNEVMDRSLSYLLSDQG